MSFRKQPPPPSPPWTTETDKYSKNKETQFIIFSLLQFKYAVTTVVFLTIWFCVLIFFFWFPPSKTVTQPQNNLALKPSTAAVTSSCGLNVSVYMYELPPEFNLGLLDDCRHLSHYTMCPYVVNSGLGRPVSDIGDGGSTESTPTKSSWFATHQFIAEMIFHARVENHPCRTRDPSRATLFYVPFYGGLYASSKFRELNMTARDELAVKLGEYLEDQPWWRRRHGKDHFLALGRTAWDFMRLTNSGTDFGANCLLGLPPVKNMSVLTVERNPWNGPNQFGIPYPSYFHPYTSDEMSTWQNQVRRIRRPHLFSFIGGTRKGLEKAAIRDKLIRQCAKSTRCELVKCDHTSTSVCYTPIDILNVMKRSTFCLQAPGDSFTRRSTFDSMLSGCIPVFFSPHTVYSQYGWFFPDDRSSYSVYIDKKSDACRRIEEELLKIPEEKVERMRETIIDLIPRVTYVHPNSTNDHRRFHDAVDVALLGLSKHVWSELLQSQRKMRY